MSKYISPLVVLTEIAAPQGQPVTSQYIRKFVKFTVFNPTADPIVLEVFITSGVIAAGSTNQVLKKEIASGDTDICAELVGTELSEGYSLRAKGKNLNFSFVASDTALVG